MKFEKKDVIFWICIIGAIVSLILKRVFPNPPFDDFPLAFIIGSLLYLYATVGEMKGGIALMPTGEEVRRIIREELKGGNSKAFSVTPY